MAGILIDIPGISVLVVISHFPSCMFGPDPAMEIEKELSMIIEITSNFLNISTLPSSEYSGTFIFSVFTTQFRCCNDRSFRKWTE